VVGAGRAGRQGKQQAEHAGRANIKGWLLPTH
jgi:hypothetical protein